MELIKLSGNPPNMQPNYLSFFLLLVFTGSFAQYQFEPSNEHPYGLPNPAAPAELLDFAPLIGECDCTSVSRKADQSWAAPLDMIWRFKYIMNGMAVQDETLKADGKHSGSIRQFIPDSTLWYVHYYNSSAPSATLPTWEGNKNEEGNIVLYRQQKAPNGMDGSYRLTFSDISEDGFKWAGEWVSADESIVYPTWTIDCSRRVPTNTTEEKELILKKARAFSMAYMEADYESIANTYTEDGKIFPNNSAIIEGRDAIKKRWMLPEGSKVLDHQLLPEAINVMGNVAYDYGYYQGQTQGKSGLVTAFKGKYVVIWKKINGDWKMYLDIWNRVADEQ
jgi:ketosteroid isomerase-like protein